MKLMILALCFMVVYEVYAEDVKTCTLSNGVVIKAGETVPAPEPGQCYKMTCHEDGSLSALTCPAFQVHPPCKRVKGDKDAIYPNCCDHAKCPDPEDK